VEEVRVKLKGNIILHTHPIMERKLKVPDGHVIIDTEAFFEVFKIVDETKNEKKIE
jgi:hypothetical protein